MSDRAINKFLLIDILKRNGIKFKKEKCYLELSKAILEKGKNYKKFPFSLQYLNMYMKDRNSFINYSQSIIENIGEDIIREHLLEIVDEIRGFIDEN